MSLLAVGLSITRTRAIALSIVIAVALAAYVVFFQDFSESLIAFLTLMIVWSSAWCGVFLADMLLRRGHYDLEALHQHTGGAYWYRGGWNVRANGWFFAGVVASAVFASSTIWTGPLTPWIGGGDLSIFAGLLVAAVGYYVHSRARGTTTEAGPTAGSTPSVRPGTAAGS
jgi:purine-cytosine permease-like protein